MIAAIITYLETNKVALGLNLVAGAAAYQHAAQSVPAATPAAYVMLLDERAGPNSVTPDVHQRVTAQVGIVLVVCNVADATGAAAQADMDALSALVKAKLLGWQPSAGHDPLERTESHLLGFKDSHIWWQDSYTTAYYDRSVL